MEVGLSPSDFVLDGDPAPLPKRGRSFLPNFRLMFIVAKRLDVCHLVWRYASAYASRPRHTSIPRHTFFRLRDIVLDVDPATPDKRHTHSHPVFGPYLLWPNGWMDEEAAWYGSRPRLRTHCTRRGPSERGIASPSFRPMSIVATVAHLSYC